MDRPTHDGAWRAADPAWRARTLGAGLLLFVTLVTLNLGRTTGDLHRALVAVGAGALALGLAWLLLARPPRGARGAGLLAGAFGVVLAAGALQLVPLPRGVVATLAPATGALYDAADAAAGRTAPPPRPLSLEPVATARVLLLGAAYAAVLGAAVLVGRAPRLAARLALGLALLGGVATLVAVVGLADLPAGDRWQGRPRAPFANPNHLSALLELTLGLGLGVVLLPTPRRRSLREDARSVRGLAALAVVLTVVGIALTRSRAGLAAAGVAVVVSFALGLSGRGRRPALAAGAAALALGAGLLLADVRGVTARFEGDREAFALDDLGGRVENWRVTARLIADRPWAGSGLGTYDDASTAALTADRDRRTRPGAAHDDYLELAATGGLPAALLALAALAGAAALAIGRTLRAGPRERPLAAGALGGLAGVAAHAVFDFGLQIPAVALVALCAVGLAWGLTSRPASGAGPPAGPGRAAAAAALGLALLLGGGAAAAQSAAARRGLAAFAAATDLDVRVDLRPELARRAAAALRPARGPRARADVDYALAMARALDPATAPADAVAAARAAVAKAPADCQHQMALAWLLLDRWRRAGEAADPAWRREGEARLELAVSLGPTVPEVLFRAGLWRLELAARVEGAPEQARQAERAAELLGAAIARDRSRRRAIARALDARAALLGARGEALRRRLALDEGRR